MVGTWRERGVEVCVVYLYLGLGIVVVIVEDVGGIVIAEIGVAWMEMQGRRCSMGALRRWVMEREVERASGLLMVRW